MIGFGRTIGAAAIFLLSTTAAGAVSEAVPVAKTTSVCTPQWQVFDARPYRQTLFPDTNVSYWRYRFVPPEHGRLALRVRGRLPKARYMSMTTYDQADFNGLSSLHDQQLRRRDGRDTFELSVLPDSDVGEHERESHVLRYPSPSRTESKRRGAELWYRIYLPQDGSGGTGGGELPSIEAFDLETGEPLECPSQSLINPGVGDFAGSLPPPPGRRRFVMHRPTPGGIYASLHNQYIAARLPIAPNTVTILSFKPPSIPSEDQDGRPSDVRYWSLCIGGLSTLTSSCLADQAIRVAGDGTVRVVLGPPRVASAARARGYHFLSRGLHAAPVLLYRNLLAAPEFEGHFQLIPEWSRGAGADPAELEAQRFIGDYAPVGEHCTASEFIRGACGTFR